MTTVALVAGTLAALAVIILVIRVLFLVRRVQQVWERLDQAVEGDLRPGIREWGEAARGIRRAAGKLEGNLTSLGRTLDWVGLFTDKLEPELVAHLLTGPLGRLASWVAGVRRGLRAYRRKDGAAGRPGSRSEGEGERGD